MEPARPDGSGPGAVEGVEDEMKRPFGIVTFAAVLFGAEQTIAQDWVEQFDTYNLAPLANQSLWEQWDGSNAVDAMVVDTPTLTADRAVRITGQPALGRQNGDDVVWDFDNSGGQPTSGTWISSTRTYVPSGANGTGWFIMLNQYPDSKNWSLQIQFDSSSGVVHAAEPGGIDQTLIYDEWVQLITCIDLDNMQKLTQAGAIICPASPGFYKKPQSIEDLVDFVVGRLLDLLDIK